MIRSVIAAWTQKALPMGILLCALVWALSSPCIAKPLKMVPVVDEVCIETGPCFSVTLAQTDAARAKGLMYRSFLAPQEGMLFVFEKEDIHSFWMKDTLISLDIVWLSATQRVVYIETQTVPMSTRSLVPTAKSKYVLEVVGGTAKRLGLKVGDRLDFRSSKTP